MQFRDPASTFVNPDDLERIDRDDLLVIDDVRNAIIKNRQVSITNKTKSETYEAEHAMSERQTEMVLAGSLINLVK